MFSVSLVYRFANGADGAPGNANFVKLIISFILTLPISAPIIAFRTLLIKEA